MICYFYLTIVIGLYCTQLQTGVSGLLRTLEKLDECISATSIGNYKRSTAYKKQNEELGVCDDSNVIDESKWYKFESYIGGQMLEGKSEAPCSVQTGYCGTTAPIWMIGEHPTDLQTSSVEVCANYFDPGNGECCGWKANITVKHCKDEKNDTFYVYQLATVEGCPAAYCVEGQRLPCELNETWDGEECVLDIPPDIQTVVMSKPIPPKTPGDSFTFSCSVQMENYTNDMALTILWLADTIQFKEEKLVFPKTVSVITEEELGGSLGKHLQCRAVGKLKYGRAETSIRSEPPYWIGIKGPDDIVVIKESRGEPKLIPITSTVPITCGGNRNNPRLINNNCPLKLFVQAPNKKIKFQKACQLLFVQTNMTAHLSIDLKGGIAMSVNVITYLSIVENTAAFVRNGIWKGFQVPNIQIQIQDTVKAGQCTSTSDPHIKTFDGVYYEVFAPGQFVLVKSDLSSRFEVHMRVRRCSKSGAGCACAVAVREGYTIISVDECKSVSRKSRRNFFSSIRYSGKRTGSITIQGNKAKITMPSGTVVTVITGTYWGLNIYITVPSKYKYHTKGLCGTFDGNKKNDFTAGDIILPTEPRIYPFLRKKFVEAFRIPNGLSFFDPGYPLCDNFASQVSYCKCINQKTECGFQDNSKQFVEFKFPCKSKKIKNRHKRTAEVSLKELSLESGYSDDPPIDSILGYTFDNSPTNDTVNITWPSPSGITEEDAEDKCEQVFQNSPSYEFCKDQVDLKGLQDNCKIDIVLTDNINASDSMGTDMEEDCKFNVESNIIEGSPDEATQKQLLNNIEQRVCIGQCSESGDCQNGECVCNTDYIGFDCSIKKDVAPQMINLDTTLCDLQERPCKLIRVEANGVTDTLDLKCRISHVELSEDGSPITINTTEVTGRLVSASKVICLLPVTPVSPEYSEGDHSTEYMMYISVSNDGAHFSASKLLVVYDSMCRECTQNGICTMKVDSCSLNGECYTGNDCTACSKYNDIGNPYRSTAYQMQSTGLCDNTIQEDVWYRFDQYTGGEMPGDCVSENNCGTKAPIWLKNGHPIIKQPIFEGTICSNLGDSSNDCCVWNASISVQWCNQSYYVYKLVPVPQCDMAYCSGNKIPCSITQEWSQELQKCITVCPVGQYLEGLVCKLCVDGYFQDNTGMSECKACPGQSDKVSTNGTGATSKNQCYNTDECSQNMHNCKPASHGGSCVDKPKWGYTCECKSGWFGTHPDCIMICPSGSQYNDSVNKCTSCPKGTYKSDGDKVCEPCPTGFTTKSQATTVSQGCNIAVCLVGQHADGPVCKSCEDGYFQDNPGMLECKACPGHKDKVSTNGTGATSSDQCYNTDECSQNLHTCKPASHGGSCVDKPKWGYTCECKSGWYGTHPDCILICPSGNHYNVSVNDCIPCPKGTYKSDGNKVCEPCNTGFTTETHGTKESQGCNIAVCPAGQYSEGSVCKLCADGYFQDTPGMSECKACPGQSDKVSTNGTGATSSIQCYNTDECSQILHNCEPASRGGSCVDLPKWGYTCLCKSGWYGTYPDCILICPSGSQYNTSINECTPCPKGTYKSDGDKVCEGCPTGLTTETQATTASVGCNIAVCSVGQHADGPVCKLCEDGYFQDTPGMLECKACPGQSDKVSTNGTGATSGDQCYNTNECDLGIHDCYSTESEGLCVDLPKWGYSCVFSCPPGTYKLQGGRVCVKCPNATYHSVAEDKCVPCPAGVTSQAGSTSASECDTAFCNKGKYASGLECLDCQDGYYQDTEGSNACKPCGTDLSVVSTNGTGATSALNCYDTDECSQNLHKCKPASHGGLCVDQPKWGYTCVCMPGWYGTHPDCTMICPLGSQFNDSLNDCTPCPKGTYKDDGDKVCQGCTKGFTTELEGTKQPQGCNIAVCPVGQYADGRICKSCDDGYFQDTPGMLECKACPGQTDQVSTNGTGATSSDQCYNTDECNQKLHNCKPANYGGSCVDQPKWGYICICIIGWYGTYPDCKLICPSGSQYNDSLNDCVPCPKGTYKDEGDKMCQACTTGLTTEFEGTKNAQGCNIAICESGQYSQGSICLDCEDGYYQNEAGSTQCIPCGDNLDVVTTNGTGAASFSSCQNTDECNQKLHNCKPAHYGGSCVDQPKWGYICICIIGWYGTYPDCKLICPSGSQYNDSLNDCVPCPKGTYKDEGDKMCQACTTGLTTEFERTKNAQGCNIAICERGQYSMGSICLDCEDGYYQNEAGSTQCIPCGDNLDVVTTNGTGSVSFSSCQNTNECELGIHNCQSTEAQAFCVDMPKWGYSCVYACPIGSYNPEGDNVCAKCPNATYRGVTEDKCVPCPTGTTSNMGSTSVAACSGAAWNPWSNWASCSQTSKCVSGYSFRYRSCSSNSVECNPKGESAQHKICTYTECQDEEQLIVVWTSDTEVLKHMDQLSKEFKDLINKYCDKWADKCCKYIGFDSQRSPVDSLLWVDNSTVDLHKEKENQLGLLVQLSVDNENVIQMCNRKKSSIKDNRRKRTTNELLSNIPGELIQEALTDSDNKLEVYGLNITSVQYPTVLPPLTSSTEKFTPDKTSSNVWIIIGILIPIAVLVVIALIVALGLHTLKQKREKHSFQSLNHEVSSTPRSNSVFDERDYRSYPGRMPYVSFDSLYRESDQVGGVKLYGSDINSHDNHHTVVPQRRKSVSYINDISARRLSEPKPLRRHSGILSELHPGRRYSVVSHYSSGILSQAHPSRMSVSSKLNKY